MVVCSNFINHSKHDSHSQLGKLFDHLITHMIFTLTNEQDIHTNSKSNKGEWLRTQLGFANYHALIACFTSYNNKQVRSEKRPFKACLLLSHVTLNELISQVPAPHRSGGCVMFKWQAAGLSIGELTVTYRDLFNLESLNLG